MTVKNDRHCWLALCLAMLVLPATGGELAALRVVAADLPPFSVASGSGTPGALVEIVELLAATAGVATKVEFVPWKRATVLPQSGKRIAIFPLTRTPERERQYRWLVKLFKQDFVLVARRSSALPLDDTDAMRGRRILVLRGSPHLKYLQEQGFKLVTEATSVEDMQRMLVAGMADAIYGSEAINRAILGRTHRTMAEFTFSAPLNSGDIWLGGSLDFSDADAKALRSALDKVIADGRYQAILQRYQLVK